MNAGFREFWLCFVPAFVAVDAIGILPVFMSLTEGLDSGRLRDVVRQSVITAAAVAAIFLTVGPAILKLMGITVADFMVAGGVLLFVISMSDLLRAEKGHRLISPDSVGAVPIGVPLITGPAVLTTSILLVNTYGILPASVAILSNILIAGIIFRFSESIHRILGKAGAKTLSKIASLFLAAIAVMIVRRGIADFIAHGLSNQATR